MIYVKRTKVPDDLSLPVERIRREKQQVFEYFIAGKKSAEKIKIEAYNTDGVKDALKLMFFGKCAYCENKMLAVSSGDIEHFRPKALIKNVGEKPVVPGYFYLAYEWDNLLLSCERCNRGIGKKNQFPVKPKGVYYIDSAKGISEIEEKCRLLLNPCIDIPEKHLIYLENGAMQASTLEDNQPSEMGEASIQVYALNRAELIEDRCKLIKNIKLFVGLVLNKQKQIAGAMRANDAELIASLQDELILLLAQLDSFKKETEPFTGLSRQLVDLYLEHNNAI